MGIRSNARVWIYKIKHWLNPLKKIRWHISETDRVVSCIATSLQNLIEVNIKNVHERINAFENEPALRKAQGKRANEKLRESIKMINRNFDEINHSISKLNTVVNEQFDKFDRLDTLKNKVKIGYDQYIKDLHLYHEKHIARLHEVIEQYKTEISQFKKNDNAVVRLAGLEERITLMEIKHREIKHNGSGKTVPRSIRAD